jgi:hypothetical protein
VLGVDWSDDDDSIEVSFDGIYPENWQTWLAWLACDDQWIESAAGRRIGLRSEAVLDTLDRHPDITDVWDSFEGVRYLSKLCVLHWAERK